ncbi:YtxH domain-containing protein [Neobacillus rhizophilus]|uniref:YtxH domain-containing protein n=1 Tax=Neobacillus rhizophilus TaxID=2833579 RepID=A0A942U6J9_9BACI|nr:YtxH domain-containing protein [Neobacillus rhizophilus]MBS4213608.1 YtxH domain-containing protein [Neobacillus rhizophilus]MBU8917985.1 YtxH domain-containing protein [Bacillus sp. FJAT-29953]
MTKNKFWQGMLIGAIAGGAVSLFDKQTRQIMKEHVGRVSGKVSYVVRHPGEMVGKVKETAEKIMDTVEQAGEDISYIMDKVDELRDLTPKVTETIKETKKSFKNEDQADMVEEIFAEKEYN